MRDILFERKVSSGFTLLEMLIVIAIIGVLSAVGFGMSTQFNKAQLVEATTLDFANTLQVAKSRATSQVKPTGCTGTLQMFRVVVSSDARQYGLRAVCSTGVKDYPFKKLPSTVTMTRPIDGVSFPVLSNSADVGGGASVVFTFTASGVSRSVTIYNDGRIVAE